MKQYFSKFSILNDCAKNILTMIETEASKKKKNSLTLFKNRTCGHKNWKLETLNLILIAPIARYNTVLKTQIFKNNTKIILRKRNNKMKPIQKTSVANPIERKL